VNWLNSIGIYDHRLGKVLNFIKVNSLYLVLIIQVIPKGFNSSIKLQENGENNINN
jgi:hypothetical protein